MTSDAKNRRIELRLRADLVAALDAYCAAEFVSRSWIVSKLLRRILPDIPGNSVNMIQSLLLTGKTPADARQMPSGYPATSRPPDPARVSTEQTPDPEKRSISSKEVVRPEQGFPAFAAELQGILNAAGCDHRLDDMAAERAVFDRMRPPSPAIGPPATEAQIRDFVQAKAKELGGTEYASGLTLTGLLDKRFWTRRGTVGAEDRGGAVKATRAASERQEVAVRRAAPTTALMDQRDAEERAALPPEEQAKKAAEMVAMLRKSTGHAALKGEDE